MGCIFRVNLFGGMRSSKKCLNSEILKLLQNFSTSESSSTKTDKRDSTLGSKIDSHAIETLTTELPSHTVDP